MSNFWKNYFNQNTELFKRSLYKQVGKTVDGIEINDKQLDYIICSIIDSLHLSKEDAVIDLCCGNGLITRNVALNVKKVIGVDFSAGLVNMANSESHADNINYVASDVLQLPTTFFSQASKFYMYEALQHFSAEMFKQLLNNMCATESNMKFFIGSVPDKGKLWDYYDTEEKKLFYLQREKDNKPHMGKWWEKSELLSIASQYGFEASFFQQNSLLYTSYYRFNCMLEKR